MSYSLRDAAELESRAVPTVVFANDVFRPIAYGTAEIVGFSQAYVAQNVVFFPHPTSNLTKAQVHALVDERIDTIVDSLLGKRADLAPETEAPTRPTDLGAIRALIDPLCASLREDGAVLVVRAIDGGVVQAQLEVDEAACADGSCVLPQRNLVALLEATLRERFADIRVVLDDSRERSGATAENVGVKPPDA